jgi:uncharacterized damage-inducible protein DinB
MTEAWLGGPVEGVPALLMPAAHSFLQVKRELPTLLDGLSLEQIWRRPGASTSIGFHAIHLAGATDRLLTYARGEQLTDNQVNASRAERMITELAADELVLRVSRAMDGAIAQLRQTPSAIIGEVREVGRLRLPSTVHGLLFHAAEHATRHMGQIATLRKIVAGPDAHGTRDFS